MNVALTLVGLRDEKIGDVSTDTILVTNSIASKDLLEPDLVVSENIQGKRAHLRALISARSQFCRLIIEIISGAALPWSNSRPTWVAARSP
jgi:hypothetical protein